MLYIKANAPLGINDNNQYGLVNTTTYSEVFVIEGFDLNKTDGEQTVKFNYKSSGRYMVAKPEGEPDDKPIIKFDPPAGNALK